MNNKLNKRYGLFVAICMVVGIVIGSGVFFKADKVLSSTGNNMSLGVVAWLIGGVVMLGCVMMFANFARKHSKVNGLVDYAEAIVGPKYAYVLGSFATYIYYPAMTSVLGWVCSMYTFQLFGVYNETQLPCLLLGIGYVVLIYLLNILAPKLSGIFQTSSTVIKLIPIVIIAVIGTIAGLINGNTANSFSANSTNVDSSSIFGAICACAFAYEGWIISTSINSELKDSKKNLPIALLIGSIIIMAVYILYFIGLAGAVNINTTTSTDPLSYQAAKILFGNIGGTILKVFIVVSCLGTLNGLTVATTRAKYSLAVRGQGLYAKTFAKVNDKFNMPLNSGLLGFGLTILWLLYWFFGALNSKLGVFNFDSSELPIITIYALYIPLFICYMISEIKAKNKNILTTFIMPIIATLCSLFMVFCAFYAHGISPYLTDKSIPIVYYMIVFIIVTVVASIISIKNTNKDLEI